MSKSKSIKDFFKKPSESSDCNESATSSSETKNQKRKYDNVDTALTKKKKMRKFQNEWKTKYPWVVHDQDKDMMYCKYCREYPSLADQKSSLFIGTGSRGTFREDSLSYHQKSSKHLSCEGKWNVQNNASNPLVDVVASQSNRLDDITKKRMDSIFNTSFLIAKENLAFSKFKPLCELQAKNGLDIGSMYRNNDACRNFVDAISKTQQNKISNDIQNARFVSILADGSTDSAVIEQETVFVRYVDDKTGMSNTQFASIVPLSSANADGVLKAIDTGLECVGLNTEMVNSKVVCCNFDGASVMMGSKGGVAVKINERVQGRDLIVIHCVAHNLELAVLDAVKEVQYLSMFQSTVQEVFKFYYFSPKRRRELVEIASVLDEESIKQTGLQKTRWVASRFRALLALEKSLAVVVYHINHVACSGTGDSKPKAKGVVKELCMERFIRFLYFMLDVTKVLADISRQFQNDQLLISDVSVKLETAMLRLVELKSGTGEFTKKVKENLSTDYNLRCGKDNLQTLKIVKSPMKFESVFESFLDKIIAYVNKRFKSIQSPPVSLFSIFDHTLWPKFPSLTQYGNEQVQDLTKYFESLLSEDEMKVMAEQWLELKVRLNRQRQVSPIDAYSSLLQARPASLSAILLLVEIMFTISPSTAKCERSFSTMKVIKSGFRSSLKQSTLQNLMIIANMDESLQDFDPTSSVETWLNSTKTCRHVQAKQTLHTPVVAPASTSFSATQFPPPEPEPYEDSELPPLADDAVIRINFSDSDDDTNDDDADLD